MPEAPVQVSEGPRRWLVTWGVLLRPGWHSVVVEAFDVDEALAIARDLHPHLPQPRTAHLARQEP